MSASRDPEVTPDASMPQMCSAPATLDRDDFYAALGTAGLDARP